MATHETTTTPKEVVGAGGATRSAGTSHLRYDLIPANSDRRRAARWGLGAQQHGDYNWCDGEMPASVMIYHMEEHLRRFKLRREKLRQAAKDQKFNEAMKLHRDDDDDLAACAWAFDALMYLEDYRPDLLIK